MIARRDRPHLRPLTVNEQRVLERFFSKLALQWRKIILNPMALDIPGALYTDIFDVPDWVLDLMNALPSHYSAGLYIGYIEGNRFKPSLPLARTLSPMCGEALRCAIVNEDGEKRFLYGRQLDESHLITWVKGLTIVVNEFKEPLGWGLGLVRGKRKVIKPVWDLGWYLRRGG